MAARGVVRADTGRVVASTRLGIAEAELCATGKEYGVERRSPSWIRSNGRDDFFGHVLTACERICAAKRHRCSNQAISSGVLL